MGLRSNFMSILPLLLLFAFTFKSQSFAQYVAKPAAGAVPSASALSPTAAVSPAGAAVGAESPAGAAAVSPASAAVGAESPVGAAAGAVSPAGAYSTAKPADGIFDVTKFGAKPDADITPVVAAVWKEACASTTPSKVLIPKGIYKLGQSYLKGPCRSSIEFQIEGTLQAPPNPEGEGMLILETVDKLTLSGCGILDGQGEAGWEKNNCHLKKECAKLPMNLKLNFLTNSIVKDITSLDSKNFHINVMGCKNLTFDHVTITAPEDSPNTDGIHIGHSEQVNVMNTKISTGDDCVSVGYSVKQIVVSNVTCGPGHGIAIGSLGKYKNEEAVEGVIVKGCKLISTTNGVRIKSWPDSAVGYPATDLHFENIEMVNVSNPVLIDQEYCPWNQCNRKVPSKIKISKVSFKNITGTSATPVAVKFICSSSLPCTDVEVADIDLTYSGTEGPIVSQCSNIKPIITGKQIPPICGQPAPLEPTPTA